ncbi:MAG: ATP synthase F0 subunit C [Streptococcaceae bacterium]|jgi:F-type H+-transporting ATPase subunit c|nr:ATP synthase F0 subunit C [Streptococcaceae bacterium]
MIGNIAILALAIAAAAAAFGDAIIVSKFIEAAARQPEMESKLFSRMIIGVAFVEATFFITVAMSFVFK